MVDHHLSILANAVGNQTIRLGIISIAVGDKAMSWVGIAEEVEAIEEGSACILLSRTYLALDVRGKTLTGLERTGVESKDKAVTSVVLDLRKSDEEGMIRE